MTVNNKYGEWNFEFQNIHWALIDSENNKKFGKSKARDCLKTIEVKPKFYNEKASWEKFMDRT